MPEVILARLSSVQTDFFFQLVEICMTALDTLVFFLNLFNRLSKESVC